MLPRSFGPDSIPPYTHAPTHTPAEVHAASAPIPDRGLSTLTPWFVGEESLCAEEAVSDGRFSTFGSFFLPANEKVEDINGSPRSQSQMVSVLLPSTLHEYHCLRTSLFICDIH